MSKRFEKKIQRLCLLLFMLLCSVGARLYGPTHWPEGDEQPARLRKPIVELPINFGKTHFIVGLSKEETSNRSQPSSYVADETCAVDEIYFSPEDDLQKKLISYIDAEQKAIYVAIFSFTDRKIAQALVRAKERGVEVIVVADPGFLRDRYTKIGWLAGHGIPIYMYDPKTSPNHQATISNVMHHKFVIFFQNRDDRALVWTGSFNFTKSARLSNQENVVVLASAKVVARYHEKFEKLKNSGIPYMGAQQGYRR